MACRSQAGSLYLKHSRNITLPGFEKNPYLRCNTVFLGVYYERVYYHACLCSGIQLFLALFPSIISSHAHSVYTTQISGAASGFVKNFMPIMQ